MTVYTRNFLHFHGYIRKPLADKYVFIDDKLDVSLCDVKLN